MMKGISRNTKLLSLASFLVDISSEMIYPLLPFFLTNVLLAPAFIIGLMESLGGFTIAVSGFLSGIYSERIGKRKSIIIAGYSISALFKAVLVFLTSWPQLVFLRVLERAGKGIRDVPRDALIGLSEEKNNLGKAFGFRQMLDNAGAMLGPLIATLLLAMLSDGLLDETYRLIFIVSVVPAIIAVIVLFFIQDHPTQKAPATQIPGSVIDSGQIRHFLIAGSVFSLGQFSMMFFLLRANDFAPLVLIPVLYLAYNVFYTLFALPAGMLSDRIGAKRTLMLGMLLFLAALSGFAFFPSTLMMFFVFALLGFFMAISETVPQTLIVRSVDRSQYASAIGTYRGLIGVCALPANLVAGILYTFTIFSSPATFIFSMLTTIVGIILLAILVKEQQ